MPVDDFRTIHHFEALKKESDWIAGVCFAVMNVRAVTSPGRYWYGYLMRPHYCLRRCFSPTRDYIQKLLSKSLREKQTLLSRAFNIYSHVVQMHLFGLIY